MTTTTTTSTSNDSAVVERRAAHDSVAACEGLLALSGNPHGRAFVEKVQMRPSKKPQRGNAREAGRHHEGEPPSVAPSVDTVVTRQRHHEYSRELAEKVIDDEGRPDVIAIDDDDVVEPDNLIRAIDDLLAHIPWFTPPVRKSLCVASTTRLRQPAPRRVSVTGAVGSETSTFPAAPTESPLLRIGNDLQHTETAHRIELAALRTLLLLKEQRAVVWTLQQQQPSHQRTAAAYLVLVRNCQQIVQRRRLYGPAIVNLVKKEAAKETATRGTKRPATTTASGGTKKKVRFQAPAHTEQQQQQRSNDTREESAAPFTPLPANVIFTPPVEASLEQVLREMTLLQQIHGEIYQLWIDEHVLASTTERGALGPGLSKLQAQPLAFSFCWQLLQDLWGSPMALSSALLVVKNKKAPALSPALHVANNNQAPALPPISPIRRNDCLDMPRHIHQQEAALYQAAAADPSSLDWSALTRRLVTRLRRNETTTTPQEPRNSATTPNNLEHQENDDPSGHGPAWNGRSLETPQQAPPTGRESNKDLDNLECDHPWTDSAMSRDLPALNQNSQIPKTCGRVHTKPGKDSLDLRHASDIDEPSFHSRRVVSFEPQQEQQPLAHVATPDPQGNDKDRSQGRATHRPKSGHDHHLGVSCARENAVVELEWSRRSTGPVRTCKSTAATRLEQRDSATSPARYHHDTVGESPEDATTEDHQGKPLQGTPPSGVRIRTIPRRNFSWKAFPEVSTWQLLCLVFVDQYLHYPSFIDLLFRVHDHAVP
jgi:hypothetical protein